MDVESEEKNLASGKSCNWAIFRQVISLYNLVQECIEYFRFIKQINKILLHKLSLDQL